GMRLAARWGLAAASSRDPVKVRARLGRMALAAKTIPETQRLEMIAGRLPAREWPARRLQITAVDAGSGEVAVFDAASGAGLVDAVAASCATPSVWPPIRIGGRHWVDGGGRSPTHAALGAGAGRGVVGAPIIRGVRPRGAGGGGGRTRRRGLAARLQRA